MLKRQLGVSCKTAWLLKHKLMHTMSQRDARYLLHGRVEIDDAYLAGERAGHINRGRKPTDKTAFAAAVQTRTDGRPLYMRLTPVADFTNEAMAQWAGHHLAPGCHVVSDGAPAFAQVRQVDATHERHVIVGGRRGARTPQVRWVNSLLGNLNASTAGTYHSFDPANYGARCLAEFCYRFNRRVDLRAMLPGLLRAMASPEPLPLKMLRI